MRIRIRRYNLKEGDHSTSGGVVIEGIPEDRLDGVPLTFLGAKVSCPTCQKIGVIVGQGPRFPDISMGKHPALEDDLCACGCTPYPRMLASQHRMYEEHEVSPTNVAPPRHTSPGSASVPPSTDALMERAAYGDRRDWTAQVGDAAPGTLRPVVLRIGMFFDGTGNNAGNTDLASQCRASSADAQGQDKAMQQAIVAHCQPYMADPHGSYGNGITNVWRLYDLYQDSTGAPFAPDAHDYFIRLYVPGIGTTTGEPDAMLGMGLGTGETGILARVAHVLDSAIPRQVQGFAQTYANAVIEAIEFDVFGFSRGAAAARHFVNMVHAQAAVTLLPAVRASGARLTRDFDAGRDLRVGFVGLFDTVVSRGSLADGLNVRSGHNGPIKVALAAGCARQVVHLVARDEHRANFMLTTVRPEHDEIALPGVHSDVGGSYDAETEGPLMLTKPVRSVEPLRTALFGRYRLPAVETTDAWRQANAERKRWIDRLGDIDPACVTVDAWQKMEVAPPAHGSVVEQRVAATYATVRLERPIDWRYQLIPLRIMHALAKEAGVKWRASPDDDLDMRLPGELYPLVDRLLDGRAPDPAQEAMLARGYLHRSANWNLMTGYGHALAEGPLYLNRPDPSGHRVVLPNENH